MLLLHAAQPTLQLWVCYCNLQPLREGALGQLLAPLSHGCTCCNDVLHILQCLFVDTNADSSVLLQHGHAGL